MFVTYEYFNPNVFKIKTEISLSICLTSKERLKKNYFSRFFNSNFHVIQFIKKEKSCVFVCLSFFFYVLKHIGMHEKVKVANRFLLIFIWGAL